MKHKILFLTIIAIITTTNIFAQLLTFPNAEIFTSNIENIKHIASNDSIVLIGTEEDTYPYEGDTYIIEKGEIEFLREREMSYDYRNTGGCVGVKRNGNLYEWNFTDVYTGEWITDFDGWGLANYYAKKGDTLVFYGGLESGWPSSYHIRLKIGDDETIILDDLINDPLSVNGHYIDNDTVYIYATMGGIGNRKTAIHKYPFDDLQNPVIDTLFGEYRYIKAFRDDYIFAVNTYDNKGVSYYLYSSENGWQEIDQSIFGDTWYGNYSLSYYDYNGQKELLISGIRQTNGDIIQIYTAGLPNTENDILTYSFSEQTGNTTINSANYTVNIEVANGTNLTNLVATFTLSDLATAFVGATEQISGTSENDFTNPVTYTIEAENEDTQEWTITVTEQQLNTENDILTFSFTEQTGDATINSTNHTIDIEIANGTNLTNLVAIFTLSDFATAFIGATEQTSGTSENDFSNPVIYIIEAENGEMQEWTITVTEATVGINTVFENEFNIYPNPTNEKINIETAEQIEKITILDISGKIILEITSTEIDLSKQKTGTYFLKIETENGIFTEKIIIE